MAELAARGTLTFSDGYRTKRSEHGWPGFRILRVADVTDGSIGLDGEDFVSEAYRGQIGSKLSQSGDILLTTKGTVGRVAVVPSLREPVVYSPQLCFFRTLDDAVLDPRWLSYWFKSPDFLRQASHRANNTDMAAYINLADIRSLEVPVTPIEQQRAIAEVLGALDDKIAANTRLVSTTDALATALIRSVITEKRVALASLASVVMGSSPPGESYNESGIGTVFYQGVRDFGVRYPANRVWTTQPVRMAHPRDTLVSVRAPVGRTNLASESTCIGRGLAAVRSTTDRPMTLFHLLRNDPAAWGPYEAEGTVFGSINRRHLEALLLPAVDHQQSDDLEVQLAALEERIASAITESGMLAEARDALLPLLMSGRVRVKDAETTVEGVV